MQPSPNRFISGYNMDDLHPNQTGFDAMHTEYLSEISEIRSVNFWYAPGLPFEA